MDKASANSLKRGKTGNEFSYYCFCPDEQELQSCYAFYENWAKSMYEYFNSANNDFNKTQGRKLEFSYTWDDSINASAKEEGNHDIISVNEGTILNAYNLFCNLTTKSNPIPLCVELPPRTMFDTNIIHTNPERPDETIHAKMVYSDNPICNNIGEHMAMFTIKFMIAHEMGHLLNAHSDLHVAICNKINEEKKKGLMWNESLNALYLDLQTLEFDADCFAICRVIDEVVVYIQRNDSLISILKHPHDLLKMVAYSIHGFFYLRRDMDSENYRISEHPPSLIREACVFDVIEAHLRKHYKYDCDKNLLFDDLPRVEQLLNSTNGLDGSLEYSSYLQSFGGKAGVHAKKLQENYYTRISHMLKTNAKVPIEGIDY